MGISRKVQREMQMQARKAFRSAIKDEAVLMEYQKRFRDGFDVGYAQAQKEFRENPTMLFPSVQPYKKEDE